MSSDLIKEIKKFAGPLLVKVYDNVYIDPKEIVSIHFDNGDKHTNKYNIIINLKLTKSIVIPISYCDRKEVMKQLLANLGLEY